MYHGETECQRPGCSKPAYYAVDERAYCGRHAQPKAERTKLPMNPDRARLDAARVAEHAVTVTLAAAANRSMQRRGRVTCRKLAMFHQKLSVLLDGHHNVAPNYRHRSFLGGHGAPSLSPKSMGPVAHGQPGLPPARSVENFHQGSKWFATQTLAAFEATQRQMFEDREPHRHHPEARKIKAGANRNIPKCFVWRTADGTRHELTYIESRQFYCTFYERFALGRMPGTATEGTPAFAAARDFALLRARLDAGENLCIWGYDARDDPDPERAEEYYLDASRPFGHEMVLWTLLLWPDQPDRWPWRRHTTFEF